MHRAVEDAAAELARSIEKATPRHARADVGHVAMRASRASSIVRVLLIGPPWGDVYGRFRSAAKVGVFYPPLGLCYLASALERAGHRARVIDAEAEELDLDGIVAACERARPDLVGIQVVSPLWDVAVAISAAVRERLGCPIVLGGPHVSITGEEALEQNPHASFGAIGEGEETIVELADRLARGAPPDDVAGLVHRTSNGVARTTARAAIRDLDGLAFPDRGDLPAHRYLFGVPGRGVARCATIATSRGCPFECTFCTEPALFGRRTRFRSPEDVVDEIESTKRRTGATHFVFVDDTLTVEKKRVHAMCEDVLRRGLSITLEGWTHANTVDVELLRAMRRAGLVRLSFGVESGDEDVLRSLKKGTDHERIRAAYRAAKSVGLETRGSVILGLPGDTRASVERTIRFVVELDDLDHCYFNVAMPYPGTRIREIALRGEMGTRLLSREYSVLRRQGGSVVMEVNDLGARDLAALQRSAYRRFWLRPRRVVHNALRAGPRAAASSGVAFVRSFVLPPRPSGFAFASDVTRLVDRERAPARATSP